MSAILEAKAATSTAAPPAPTAEDEQNPETVAMGEQCCNDPPLTESGKTQKAFDFVKISLF